MLAAAGGDEARGAVREQSQVQESVGLTSQPGARAGDTGSCRMFSREVGGRAGGDGVAASLVWVPVLSLGCELYDLLLKITSRPRGGWVAK